MEVQWPPDVKPSVIQPFEMITAMIKMPTEKTMTVLAEFISIDICYFTL